MGVWSRKSVALCIEEALGERGPHLQRSLGVWALTAFGVGCTIGAGIFSLTGDVAAHQAGPAVSLAFVLASIACFFAGLCYAEFAAMVPISGSAYSYAYVTLGELVAWIIGWSLVLEWLFSASLVAISWSGYVRAGARRPGRRPSRRRSARRPSRSTRARHGRHRCPAGSAGGAGGPRAVPRSCSPGPALRPRSIPRSCWPRYSRSSCWWSWVCATCTRRTGSRSSPHNTGSFGAFRLVGPGAGRRHPVLRLHRLRWRVDARRGGAQPAAHAALEPVRLAPRLHGAVRRREHRGHRARGLPLARRRRSSLLRALRRARAARVRQGAGERRGDRRTRVGGARQHRRPGADLLLDGARRPAAAGARPRERPRSRRRSSARSSPAASPRVIAGARARSVRSAS